MIEGIQRHSNRLGTSGPSRSPCVPDEKHTVTVQPTGLMTALGIIGSTSFPQASPQKVSRRDVKLTS